MVECRVDIEAISTIDCVFREVDIVFVKDIERWSVFDSVRTDKLAVGEAMRDELCETPESVRVGVTDPVAERVLRERDAVWY